MEASEYFQQLVDRTVSLVVDDVEAAAMGRSLGFPVTLFDEYSFSETQERPALVVITQTASIPRLHALWGKAAAPFCHLALAKFDGSSASLSYALQRLLSADAAAALSQRADTYEQMLSCQDLEITTTAGVLHCHLRDELEIPNSGDEIQPGWLYSIAEFFEASVVNLEEERSSFWVEGDFACEGLIYLCNSAELKARFAPQLDDVLHRVATAGATLHFTDNRIDRLRVGGQDMTESFLALLSGLERESAVTELGIGCSKFGTPMEGGRNVVLHKSELGVYIGIGKGLHIPHIDFVSRNAQLRYLPTPSSA